MARSTTSANPVQACNRCGLITIASVKDAANCSTVPVIAPIRSVYLAA
jgi:hypothetical protein